MVRDRCDELSAARTIAVTVVVELSGGGVVDDAIVGIVSGRRTRGRIEATIAGSEASGRSDVGENCCVELDIVPTSVEVGQQVGIHGAVFVERDAVLASTPTHLVVARAALYPIDAFVAADIIVATAAIDGVRPAAPEQRIVAV